MPDLPEQLRERRGVGRLMAVAQIGQAEGTCWRCGRTYYASRLGRGDRTIACECWLICELDDGPMTRVADTQDPKTYGRATNEHGQILTLATVAKCDDCGWLSEQIPVEVILE